MSENNEQLESVFTVSNSLGLHARPASMFVELSSSFDAEIMVEKNGESVNGKSLMGLLMLSAGYGSEIKIVVTGSDASEAMEAISDLFNRNFDEE